MNYNISFEFASMQSKVIAIGLFLVWITHKISYNDAAQAKFTNVVCESYNKSWVVVNYCRLRAKSRNRTVFNLNITIIHPCSNIIADVQFFKRANGYKPWLLKMTVDVCRFFKKTYNPWATLIYSQFKEFTNLNHTCPYVDDTILEGFYLRPELMRLPFPTGDYLLNITWILDKKRMYFTNVYFMFIEDL